MRRGGLLNLQLKTRPALRRVRHSLGGGGSLGEAGNPEPDLWPTKHTNHTKGELPANRRESGSVAAPVTARGIGILNPERETRNSELGFLAHERHGNDEGGDREAARRDDRIGKD